MPVVLNLDTGKITTQYHVIIDDWFKTVHVSASTSIDFNSDNWYRTFGLTEWQYTPDDDDRILNLCTNQKIFFFKAMIDNDHSTNDAYQSN